MANSLRSGRVPPGPTGEQCLRRPTPTPPGPLSSFFPPDPFSFGFSPFYHAVALRLSPGLLSSRPPSAALSAGVPRKAQFLFFVVARVLSMFYRLIITINQA